MNARLIKANTSLIQQSLRTETPQIIAITETYWAMRLANEQCDYFLKEISSIGHKSFSFCRQNKRGGGLAFICHEGFSPKLKSKNTYETFEHLIVSVSLHKTCINFVVIYRPPSISVSKFLHDFTNLSEHLISLRNPFVLLGDFNSHVDNPNNSSARQFLDLLKSFSLQQLVNEPTHLKGQILDLIITPDSIHVRLSMPRTEDLISDHFMVTCDLNTFNGPQKNTKTLSFRKTSQSDIISFRADLNKSDRVQNLSDNLDQSVTQYNKTLSSLSDKHAPVKTISVNPKRSKWYTSEIHALRTEDELLKDNTKNQRLGKT